MSTFIKKAITELDEAASVSKDDVLLISLRDSNDDLISKQVTTETLLSPYVKKVLDSDSTHVAICGGSSLDNTGAKIVLTGKNEPGSEGFLYLDANDGTNDARLSLRPNGELYLYDDESDMKTHIIRGIKKSTTDTIKKADAAGNVIINYAEADHTHSNYVDSTAADRSYVKKVGDTMTGALTISTNTTTSLLKLKHPGAERGSVPLQQLPVAINMADKNDKLIGTVKSAINDNGDIQTGLYAYDPNNVTTYDSTSLVCVNGKGTRSSYVTSSTDFIANGDIIANRGNITATGTINVTGNIITNANITLSNDSGDIYGKDTRGIHVFGSGTSYDNSPSLALHGSGLTNSPGTFILRSGAGVGLQHELIGTKDGALKWDTKHIVRSINNITADNNGNVSLDLNYASSTHNHDGRYLKPSLVTVNSSMTTGTKIATINVNGNTTDLYAPGGSSGPGTHNHDGIYFPLSGVNYYKPISGDIWIDNKDDNKGFIRLCNNNTALRLYGGGYDATGAAIHLYGKEHTNKGMFLIAAISSSNTNDRKFLNGYPNGQLTWDYKNIVRSINNITADINGNVILNASNIGAAPTTHTHSNYVLTSNVMQTSSNITANIDSTTKVPSINAITDWCNSNFLRTVGFADPSEMIAMLQSMLSESNANYYVDPQKGKDPYEDSSYTGTRLKPFRTIYTAVKTANKRRFVGNSNCNIHLMSNLILAVNSEGRAGENVNGKIEPIILYHPDLVQTKFMTLTGLDNKLTLISFQSKLSTHHASSKVFLSIITCHCKTKIQYIHIDGNISNPRTTPASYLISSPSTVICCKFTHYSYAVYNPSECMQSVFIHGKCSIITRVHSIISNISVKWVSNYAIYSIENGSVMIRSSPSYPFIIQTSQAAGNYFKCQDGGKLLIDFVPYDYIHSNAWNFDNNNDIYFNSYNESQTREPNNGYSNAYYAFICSGNIPLSAKLDDVVTNDDKWYASYSYNGHVSSGNISKTNTYMLNYLYGVDVTDKTACYTDYGYYRASALYSWFAIFNYGAKHWNTYYFDWDNTYWNNDNKCWTYDTNDSREPSYDAN